MKTFSRIVGLAPIAVALLSASIARGQGAAPVVLQVSAADRAAQEVSTTGVSGGAAVTGKSAANLFGLRHGDDDGQHSAGIAAPGFYGTDVGNASGGPTIVSAQHHPIYVNGPATHWGDPAAFLADLGDSEFIHLVDQYVGAISDHRYTMGSSFFTTYPIPPEDHTLHRSDIAAILHAAAAQGGSGYGHIYHVFLPQGVDVCYPLSANFCYSPDVPASFAFCALHQSLTFSDSVGHVIYTLEPYQNVAGCAVPPQGTPNGQTADSTDNSLSHETFEAISDPDVDAWVGISGPAQGQEIADLCTYSSYGPDGNLYSTAPNVKLHHHWYSVQAVYSNQIHACVYGNRGEEGGR